jgi:transglutaminase superfamily protein
MPTARRLISLPASDWRLVLLSIPVVLGVRVALWLLPSATILAAVRLLVDGAERLDVARRPSLERVAWAIGAVSRRVPRATCLTQAIAMQLVLRRYGYASRLCVGVGRDARGAFRAHAWVERDGRVVIGGDESLTLARLELSASHSWLPLCR